MDIWPLYKWWREEHATLMATRIFSDWNSATTFFLNWQSLPIDFTVFSVEVSRSQWHTDTVPPNLSSFHRFSFLFLFKLFYIRRPSVTVWQRRFFPLFSVQLLRAHLPTNRACHWAAAIDCCRFFLTVVWLSGHWFWSERLLLKGNQRTVSSFLFLSSALIVSLIKPIQTVLLAKFGEWRWRVISGQFGTVLLVY